MKEEFNLAANQDWNEGPAITNTVDAPNGDFTATSYDDNSTIIQFSGGPNAGTTVLIALEENKVIVDKWGEMNANDVLITLPRDERVQTEVTLEDNQIDPLASEEDFKSPTANGMSEDGFASVSKYGDGAVMIEISDGPNAGTTIYSNPEGQALTVDNWGEMNENDILMTLPRDERGHTEVSTAPPSQQQDTMAAPAAEINPAQP